MAVFQISRIQIRRGQKNSGSTGIPQLSSGELAWAIDTQELFIGNGAVSEGAPAVGNTKIITERDNVIDVIGKYRYAAKNTSIQTNEDPSIPVIQSLQDVLDRTVFAEDFDVQPGVGVDNASAIQRALDQLYLKPDMFNTSDEPTAFNAQLRVKLIFTPGWYDFSQTIKLPSFVTLVGSGIEKTVFNYTGTGTAFEFVNDTSTVGSHSSLGSTTYINQPKFAHLSNFTLKLNNADATGLKLNALRDSEITNIKILGKWAQLDGAGVSPAGFGIDLVAQSSLVTSQRNQFSNIQFSNLRYCIFSKYDVFGNAFSYCEYTESMYGVVLGLGTNKVDAGQEIGPKKNQITNSQFTHIDQYGIRIVNGYGNRSRSNTFIDVGNDQGGITAGVCSPIKFDVAGNSSLHDTFDRRDDTLVTMNDSSVVNLNLAKQSGFSYNYFIEVDGPVSYHNIEPQKIDVFEAFVSAAAFRIPLNATANGYKIDYLYKSTLFVQTRKGQLNIIIDKANGNVQLVDEFEYTGANGEDEKLFFSAAIESNCLVIYYKNQNTGDIATLTYTYTMLA